MKILLSESNGVLILGGVDEYKDIHTHANQWLGDLSAEQEIVFSCIPSQEPVNDWGQFLYGLRFFIENNSDGLSVILDKGLLKVSGERRFLLEYVKCFLFDTDDSGTHVHTDYAMDSLGCAQKGLSVVIEIE